MNRKKTLIIIGICIVAIIGFGFYRHLYSQNEDGIAYIKSEERKKTDDIATALKDKKNEETQKAIDEGKIDVFAKFQDYVLIGDSRVLGFSQYGFLPENRVYAKTGSRVTDIDEYIESLKSLQPNNVYISFGANDIVSQLDNLEGGYDGVTEAEINKILEVCPNATIYVNGIVPFGQAAIDDQAVLADYTKYNEKLESMCKKNKWNYIDNDSIVDDGNADVYQSDGIHFINDFYKTWAMNMTKEE